MNKINKYIKRPIEVEAILYNDNFMEIAEFTNSMCYMNDANLIIKTLEGDMIATVGDYIIKGIKGEIYPCKPDIFELTYDVVGT